ncbi:hypothetical protein [Rhodocaloribacter sp.]
MSLLFTFALAVVLHLILGWPWTILAGVAAGVWKGRGGWRIGALGVGLGWLAFVVYDYLVAAGAVGEMTRVMGGLMGNLPGFVVVVVTLVIGLVLGALGGAVGTQAAALAKRQA